MLPNLLSRIQLVGAIAAVAGVTLLIGMMMHEDFWPTLVVSLFVFYPFVTACSTAWVMDLTGRRRFAWPFAKVFAYIGCALAAWYLVQNGFGKVPPVTVLACAIFVLGVAATGGLVGLIVDLLVPVRANPLDDCK
jgi:hypothetical protein